MAADRDVTVDGRYSRQERFTAIGVSGQQRLMESRVLIIGAGALGSAVAESLVRAGVGDVTLIDRDYVEWSNLQRSQLYTEQDAAEHLPKAIAAEKRLKAIQSSTVIRGIVADVSVYELEQWGNDRDIIMDATNHLETRLLINDYAQKQGIPWIFGACAGSQGMYMLVEPNITPCFSCLHKLVPLEGITCDTAGIVAPAVHITAAGQAAEALKVLTGNTDALHRKLVTYDVWSNQFTATPVQAEKRGDCPSCGIQPTYPFLVAAKQRKTDILCGRDTIQLSPAKPGQLKLDEVAAQLATVPGIQLTGNPYLLSIQEEKYRVVLFRDGRILVHGTNDLLEARSVADRLLGQ